MDINKESRCVSLHNCLVLLPNVKEGPKTVDDLFCMLFPTFHRESAKQIFNEVKVGTLTKDSWKKYGLNPFYLIMRRYRALGIIKKFGDEYVILNDFEKTLLNLIKVYSELTKGSSLEISRA